MSERWRCFVAVPLDDGLRGELAEAIARWRSDPQEDGLRWVGADGLHLTLAFLGATDPDAVARIQADVDRVAAGHQAMTVRTGRLGAFPRPGSARVVWYGVGDPDGRLAALASDLADALQLPNDEPFRPHVTVARARHRNVDVRGWIDVAAADAPSGALPVRDVHLMRSHLGSGPARYETLASFPLRGSIRSD